MMKPDGNKLSSHALIVDCSGTCLYDLPYCGDPCMDSLGLENDSICAGTSKDPNSGADSLPLPMSTSPIMDCICYR
jgi:hypothetical protein